MPVLALAAVALTLGGSASAGGQRRPVDLEAADCSTINQMFGDFEVRHATEHVSIPVGSAPLEVRPDFNGGVKIERGAGGVYSVTACVAAGAATRAEAQSAAESIRLDVDGNRIRVREQSPAGRSVRTWSVQLIVAAPDGASIVAET
jgi:hypothetical protein